MPPSSTSSFASGNRRGKRDFLHRGLTGAAGAPPAHHPAEFRRDQVIPAARPSGATAAGLVTRNDAGRTFIGCGPETVHWGYLWGAAEPVAIVKPGAEVTIDTVSHEGILADQGDPVSFFARFGISKEAVLADAVAVYTKVQHSGLRRSYRLRPRLCRGRRARRHPRRPHHRGDAHARPTASTPCG